MTSLRWNTLSFGGRSANHEPILLTARDLIAACRKDLVAELHACIDHQGSELFDMIRYHLGWVDQQGAGVSLPGGKMLRPLLCLLSCHCFGGSYRPALPAAAAVEMTHNFSLIHDDIQDQSAQRRHRPTVWKLWGPAQAINAGDGLHALAHLAHLGLIEKGVSGQKTVTTLRELDRACLELCEGQYLDIRFEYETRVSLDAYLMMIAKKTAALFEGAARIGAILGGGDGPSVETIGLFGRELGLAFQVEDDILGIWGMEAQTGKPCLDDIRSRKKALPVVHCMSTASEPGRLVLEEAFLQDMMNDRTVDAVLATLEQAGSRSYCERLAKDYWDSAWRRLDTLSLGEEGKAGLKLLAADLIGRTS